MLLLCLGLSKLCYVYTVSQEKPESNSLYLLHTERIKMILILILINALLTVTQHTTQNM